MHFARSCFRDVVLSQKYSLGFASTVKRNDYLGTKKEKTTIVGDTAVQMLCAGLIR